MDLIVSLVNKIQIYQAFLNPFNQMRMLSAERLKLTIICEDHSFMLQTMLSPVLITS
jgi:hypothetical protein